MKLDEIALFHVRLPLQHPFETSFARITHHEAIVVRVVSGSVEGYGEAPVWSGPWYSAEDVHTAWHVIHDLLGPAALRGDLVEKTFLFLGFSFTDPNIDYILSRVRVQYEKHQRHHYCIQKKVTTDGKESADEFKYRQLKQDYFIRDLKRFSVYTVLVEDYEDRNLSDFMEL